MAAGDTTYRSRGSYNGPFRNCTCRCHHAPGAAGASNKTS
eukprot:gene7786-977_t